MAGTKLTLTSTLPLPNTSLAIPRLGFGVYQSPASTCVASCLAALKAGYRHIDSAQFYANETQVGKAVAESGVARRDVFLTTKIMSAGRNVDDTYERIVDSVRKMGGPAAGGEGPYVDLFLIHTPSGGAAARKTMWLALERAHGEGLCKAIGVSNFGRGHIEEMKDYAKVWPPHVDQLELHPWCQQRGTVEYCHRQGIVVQAYCPLVRNRKADDKTLLSLADKYGKGTGQVLIRYGLQKDWVPLPKSDTPSRIEGNADVYDFEISKEDMGKLDALDQGARGALVQAAKD